MLVMVLNTCKQNNLTAVLLDIAELSNLAIFQVTKYNTNVFKKSPDINSSETWLD